MKRHERRRPNTTTDIFIDGSTVSKPDSRATIRAVAIAICLLIRSPGCNIGVAEEDLDIFDEALHPMRVSAPISSRITDCSMPFLMQSLNWPNSYMTNWLGLGASLNNSVCVLNHLPTFLLWCGKMLGQAYSSTFNFSHCASLVKWEAILLLNVPLSLRCENTWLMDLKAL